MNPPEAPGVVLDTNVVLDWLVFGDPGVQSVVAAIEARTLRWRSCPRMRGELQRTLGYAALARWNPDSERVLATFDRLSLQVPNPPTLPQLRCSDPDDQVFLDLAAATACRWLLTHDRALLRLARRARAWGVHIVQPRLWLPATSSTSKP